MFLNNGLSLDQSPPYHLSLRFFFTAPLFLLTAAFFLFFFQIDFTDRWDSSALGLLHFFNLGFLLMVIMGALTQMMPVLVCAPIPRVVTVASLCHILLSLGAFFFPFGLIQGERFFIAFGAACAALSVSIFFSVILFKLWKMRGDFIAACFRLSSIAALMMILLASRLALSYSSFMNSDFDRMAWLELHIAWAFFGFVFLLILAVSHKVLPMFYVTEEYPKRMAPLIAYLSFSLLLLWTALLILLPESMFRTLGPFITGIKCGLSLCLFLFALETFRRFSTRKRKISDTTVHYWKLSMAFFMLGALLYSLLQFDLGEGRLESTAAIVLGLGIFSLIKGMLYKIIPFLTWFHLSARQLKRVPTMKEMLPERKAKREFTFHLLSLGFLSLFLFSGWGKAFFFLCFVLSLAASLLFLVINFFAPVGTYRRLSLKKS